MANSKTSRIRHLKRELIKELRQNKDIFILDDKQKAFFIDETRSRE